MMQVCYIGFINLTIDKTCDEYIEMIYPCLTQCIVSVLNVASNGAAKVPVKFQSDWKSLKPNLSASRLREI